MGRFPQNNPPPQPSRAQGEVPLPIATHSVRPRASPRPRDHGTFQPCVSGGQSSAPRGRLEAGPGLELRSARRAEWDPLPVWCGGSACSSPCAGDVSRGRDAPLLSPPALFPWSASPQQPPLPDGHDFSSLPLCGKFSVPHLITPPTTWSHGKGILAALRSRGFRPCSGVPGEGLEGHPPPHSARPHGTAWPTTWFWRQRRPVGHGWAE